ncbi:hypothetical protein ACTA71_008833 [Dictyostelium dimigraforme]
MERMFIGNDVAVIIVEGNAFVSVLDFQPVSHRSLSFILVGHIAHDGSCKSTCKLYNSLLCKVQICRADGITCETDFISLCYDKDSCANGLCEKVISTFLHISRSNN